MLPDLLHGEETRVWGDQAYRGQTAEIRECAPQAQDGTHRRYRYQDRIDEVERANESKVMKLKFGFVKLRCRGPKKNANHLFVICSLVNLYLVRNKLLVLIRLTPPGKYNIAGKQAGHLEHRSNPCMGMLNA